MYLGGQIRDCCSQQRGKTRHGLVAHRRHGYYEGARAFAAHLLLAASLALACLFVGNRVQQDMYRCGWFTAVVPPRINGSLHFVSLVTYSLNRLSPLRCDGICLKSIVHIIRCARYFFSNSISPALPWYSRKTGDFHLCETLVVLAHIAFLFFLWPGVRLRGRWRGDGDVQHRRGTVHDKTSGCRWSLACLSFVVGVTRLSLPCCLCWCWVLHQSTLLEVSQFTHTGSFMLLPAAAFG